MHINYFIWVGKQLYNASKIIQWTNREYYNNEPFRKSEKETLRCGNTWDRAEADTGPSWYTATAECYWPSYGDTELRLFLEHSLSQTHSINGQNAILYLETFRAINRSHFMIALFCGCLRDGDGRGLGGDVNVTHCLNVGTWSPTHHSPLPCSSYCYCFPNTPQRATTLRQWTRDNSWTNFNIDLSIPHPGRILTDTPPGCDTSWLNSLNFHRSKSTFIS